MIKLFFSDAIKYGVSSLLVRGINFVLLPIYTRSLDPTDYGSLDIVVIIAGLINIIITFEITQGVGRFYADEKNILNKALYASTSFWFTVLMYLIFLVFAFTNAKFLSTVIFDQEGKSDIVLVGTAFILTNGLFYLCQNQLRWKLDSTNHAIVSFLVVLIIASLSINCYLFFSLSLFQILLFMAIGNSAGIIYSLYKLRDTYCCQFRIKMLKEMLSYSSPLVVSSVAFFGYMYLDRVMIGYFLTMNEIGLYAAGFKIAAISSLALIGFQSALTPLIFSNYGNTSTPLDISKLFTIFIILGLFLYAILALFSNFWISLFANDNYIMSSGVIGNLALANILFNSYIFAPGLSIAKKTYIIVVITVVALGVNLLLNYILIPELNIYGASLSTVLCASLSAVATFFISRHFYYIPYDINCILSALGICILISINPILPDFSLLGEVLYLSTIFFLIICLLASSVLIRNLVKDWKKQLSDFK